MASSQTVRLLMLPGIGNSGPGHWQTLWASRQPGCLRFHPADWNRPDLAEWLHALDVAIDGCAAPVLLVAHSLSCLLVAHWASRQEIGEGIPHRIAQVRGAFLVAVPDPRAPVFPAEAREFGPPPGGPLPFPALIVASSDDPYGSPNHGRQMATDWAAGFVEVGAFGHLNAASGVASWDAGWHLLQAFGAGLRVQVSASKQMRSVPTA